MVLKVCLQLMWGPPTWVGSLGDGGGSFPLSGVGGWVSEGSPSLAVIKALTWAAEGGDILSLIGSLHNAVALTTLCAVTSFCPQN